MANNVSTGDTAKRVLSRLNQLKDLMERYGNGDNMPEGIDPEKAHSEADHLLLELLSILGYNEIVNAFVAIEPKWYS